MALRDDFAAFATEAFPESEVLQNAFLGVFEVTGETISPLGTVTLEALAEGHASGQNVTIRDLAKAHGKDDFNLELILNESSVRYATERGSALSFELLNVEATRVAEAIAQGVELQLGVPETARRIRENVGLLPTDQSAILRREIELKDLGVAPDDIAEELANMRRVAINRRSEVIATTEMNDAVSKGQHRKNEQVGASEKSWSTVGDDRVDPVVCETHQGQGRIPIDQPFFHGQTTTPGHPRCRCTVDYHGVDETKLAEALNI